MMTKDTPTNDGTGASVLSTSLCRAALRGPQRMIGRGYRDDWANFAGGEGRGCDWGRRGRSRCPPGHTGRHRATAVTGQTDTTPETRHQHNQ